MYRTASGIKTKHQAAVAALVFGIIFDHFAFENDRTNVQSRDQSVWPRHLSDRVRQIDDAFFGGTSYGRENGVEVCCHGLNFITKEQKAVSLRRRRNICSHMWSVFCGTCGEVQKNDPERAGHATYGFMPRVSHARIFCLQYSTFRCRFIWGYKYVVGVAD